MQRKDAILLAATDHFGRFGYRGAALRDIALQAGVGLTLLNYHFGLKASLLAAVVELHRPVWQERGDAVRRLVMGAGSAVTLAKLVEVWATAEFDAVETVVGYRFLLLRARLLEPAEESVAEPREHLRSSEVVFARAIHGLYQGASWLDVCSATTCATSGLVHGLLALHGSRDGMADSGECRMGTADRLRLMRFMIGGIHAALEPETRDGYSPSLRRQSGEYARLASETRASDV